MLASRIFNKQFGKELSISTVPRTKRVSYHDTGFMGQRQKMEFWTKLETAVFTNKTGIGKPLVTFELVIASKDVSPEEFHKSIEEVVMESSVDDLTDEDKVSNIFRDKGYIAIVKKWWQLVFLSTATFVFLIPTKTSDIDELLGSKN